MKTLSRASEMRRRASRMHKRPLALACAAALAAGQGTAWAQNNDDEAAAGPTELVITTGSRVQPRDGMNAPSPVTVVTSDQLDLMVPGNFIQGLSQMPLFYGNTSSENTAGFFTSPGAGNLNLRGIGTNRTLVLLDGKRVVTSTRFGGTDINLFPEALISRVEAVTGGASAMYGTDAVTGVTNFILDTDFDGVEAHAQSGVTSREDGENWEASITFGTDIGEKNHLILSTDHYERDGIFSYEGRDWYKAYGVVGNTTGSGAANVIRPYVVSTSATFDGLITAPGTPLHRMNFSSDGQTVTPFVNNPDNSGFFHTIAGGAGSGDFIGMDRPTIVPDYERRSAYLRFDRDVSDNVNVYVQALYGKSISTGTDVGGQFQFVFSPMTIYNDNVFLPESVRTIMNDASYSNLCDTQGTAGDTSDDIPCFTLNRMGHSSDLAGGRWNENDLTLDQQTVGFTADLEGDGFLNGWTTEGYLQFGQSRQKASQIGGIRIDRIHLAHDAVLDPATGATVCHVTMISGEYPDCVPLNPFGRGNMSAAAVDWVTGYDVGEYIETPMYYTQSGYDLGRTDAYVTEAAKVTRVKIEQEVIDWTLTGEVFHDRDNGPLSVAFGAGYREEDMNQFVRNADLPDNNMDTGRPVPPNDPLLGIRGQPGGDVNNTVGIQYSKVPNITGKMDVTEFFGEVFVPVLPGGLLDLDIAARHADYLGSGGIWAYKAGVSSQLTDSFRVRATFSHDVRAGTLADRYDQTGGAGSVNDPFNGGANTSIFVATGGDPNINPEESDTTSIGFVFQPVDIQGLSLSLDWYEVKLTDAIASLTAQQTVDQCFAGDQTLCARISRLPDGTINLVEATVLNVAKATVEGVDLEIGLNRNVDWFGGGEFIGLRLVATHLKENSTQNFQSPVIDRAGQVNLFDFPKDKAIVSANYSRGPFSAFLQWRYVGGGYRDLAQSTGVQIDDNTISSAAYTDLTLSYRLDSDNGAEITLFGTINNLMDQDPPIVASGGGLFGATQQQVNLGLHDLLGRTYTVGARVRL